MKFKRTAMVETAIEDMPATIQTEFREVAEWHEYQTYAGSVRAVSLSADADRVAAWLKERGAEEVGDAN